MAAGRLLGQGQSPSTRRAAPRKPVVLRSSDLEVVLDSSDGLPYEYRLLGTRARMLGETQNSPITATICSRATWTFSPVPLRSPSIATTEARADFRFRAVVDHKSVSDFTIRYDLKGSTLVITMRDVGEQPGFELIEVAMPALVTVTDEDAGAWLAHGDTGGSLAKLAEAKVGSLAPNRVWGKVLA